jgi:hypothetical protein
MDFHETAACVAGDDDDDFPITTTRPLFQRTTCLHSFAVNNVRAQSIYVQLNWFPCGLDPTGINLLIW